MLRREALGTLFAAFVAPRSLDKYLDTAHGTALLVDVRTGQLIAAAGATLAARGLAPPGSVVKPFVLAGLLRAGKLRAGERLPCPGQLRIGRHHLDCTHPPLGAPLAIDAALAYSCNCFVAGVAARYAPGELAEELARSGLGSRTGWLEQEAAGRIGRTASPDAQRLQALGQEAVAVTACGLAMAYARLAVAPPQPILAGLEGAVEFGTAQAACVVGLRVAGKTGSAVAPGGERIAWFGGFAPSHAPEVAVVVRVQGRSGGADAAPVAARILTAWRAGRV